MRNSYYLYPGWHNWDACERGFKYSKGRNIYIDDWDNYDGINNDSICKMYSIKSIYFAYFLVLNSVIFIDCCFSKNLPYSIVMSEIM
jgi:hypothetical protein